MLEEQTALYKIKIIKQLNEAAAAKTGLDLLRDLKSYVQNVRSDITGIEVLESKPEYILVRIVMSARRPLRCGSPESNEEREESVRVLIDQLVVSMRRDTISVISTYA